ncbi:uncharacterized protein TERG_11569 [Trichophyton rubrum CBS 118892]|uniref:Uncharacterized protein n=1 Tax=Trichophyton rubrum (strain ATCC MYA-4607 / CBS 118892) TaxID=559305 RepID=A0A080WDT5_TRIRC|nr:uncharacterized protein TERG_11569 [Trichophyton rubrum CBS 118892]KFL60236.1 hypothetical protein TERG_11569 [Trichophyton rubrum CBS 118892]
MYIFCMNGFATKWLLCAGIHENIGTPNGLKNAPGIDCGIFQRPVAMHRTYAQQSQCGMMGSKQNRKRILSWLDIALLRPSSLVGVLTSCPMTYQLARTFTT